MKADRYIGAWSFVLVLWGPPAWAQTAASLAFFKSVNASYPAPPSATLAALLADGFARTHQANPRTCIPTAIAVSDITPATADATVWRGIKSGQLKNAWTMRADMPGCALGFANYIVLRLNGDRAEQNAFREIIYSRGVTHAGFSLTRDAMKGALGAMTTALVSAKVDRAAAACGDHPVFGVREIIDDSKAAPDVYGVRFAGEWTERWHFQVCRHDVAVVMTFTADGQGGAYYHTEGNNAQVK